MTPPNRWQLLWLRLVEAVMPYLISPIGRPTRPRMLVYPAATRPRRLLSANRYPRQIIGIGIRLPDMDSTNIVPARRGKPFHPVLSIVWAKPHGAKRWHGRNDRNPFDVGTPKRCYGCGKSSGVARTAGEGGYVYACPNCPHPSD